MKTHIAKKHGYGAVCNTRSRIVVVSKDDFLKLSLEFQCVKCLTISKKKTLKIDELKIAVT